MQGQLFAEVLAEAERALRADGKVAICHIVRAEGSTPGKPGWKLLVRADGSFMGNLGGGAFEAMVIADARERLAAVRSEPEVKRYYFTEQAVRGEPTGMVCGGFAEVFLEVMRAAPLLVVCGGGPVGQALCRGAAVAGFETLVLDDREEFARPELFPAGAHVTRVDRDYQGALLEPFDRREVYVAIVTRCWETDAAALKAIVRRPPPRLRYLGLMGSRRKIARVRDEVAAAGLSLEAALDGVALHAPIGLPLGGTSPGEIAISILAEVVQERNRPADSTAMSENSTEGDDD